MRPSVLLRVRLELYFSVEYPIHHYFQENGRMFVSMRCQNTVCMYFRPTSSLMLHHSLATLEKFSVVALLVFRPR